MRWGLWEVMRSRGWSPHDGISALIGRILRGVILCRMGKQQEGTICKAGREPLPETVLDILGLLASRTMRNKCLLFKLPSSVQFSRSVMSDSLQPHELQHARPPCPSPTPRVHSAHVHRVSDAIQPSPPRSSPSPPAPNPSQHQSLFQ